MTTHAGIIVPKDNSVRTAPTGQRDVATCSDCGRPIFQTLRMMRWEHAGTNAS